MDPLSDILALLKPHSYLTAGLDLGGYWAIRFTGWPGTIKCFAVTKGSFWLGMDGVAEPVRLAEGDCLMLPNGCSFTLASDLALTPMAAGDVLGRARHGSVVVHGGGGDVMLAGNRFDVDGSKAKALLGALAPVVHLRAAEDQAALRWSMTRMMAEMREDRPGMSLVAHHLAQLMLLQVLRLHLAQESIGRVGWFYALADSQVSAALAAINAEPVIPGLLPS